MKTRATHEHGYWIRGDGAKLCREVHEGRMTFNDLVALHDGNRDAVMVGYRNWAASVGITTFPWRTKARRTDRPPIKGKTRFKTPEEIVARFLKACEDFAAEVIAAAQSELVRRLEKTERDLVAANEQVARLRGDLEALRAVAREAEAARARDILKKSGVVYGE